MSMTGFFLALLKGSWTKPDNRVRRDKGAFGRCSHTMTMHALWYGFGGSCVGLLVYRILSGWTFDAVEYLVVDNRCIAFQKKS
jgi:hypothetical protein